jgi:streptomycin 6-kinase
MVPAHSRELRTRVEDRIRNWRVEVERISETDSSIIAFGRRGLQPVVLKVVKNPGDEWRAGAIVDAFEGQGVVRVYEHVDGAMLLERLRPGDALASVTLSGDDARATEILADVIRRMIPRPVVDGVPTVHDWGQAFERYTNRMLTNTLLVRARDGSPDSGSPLSGRRTRTGAGGAAGEKGPDGLFQHPATSGDGQIPRNLVEEAHRVYVDLCASQSRPRLLHGDLHHYNVLFDSTRGWLAIDPKGVVGELEYEVGAILRNPYASPELFTEPSAIEKRLECFASKLNLNPERMVAWTFAQVVLSLIWSIEDGFSVRPRDPRIALAHALRPRLDARD